jgi:acyl-CoA synthetase (AMP-forming)/AMP-acid ligase II
MFGQPLRRLGFAVRRNETLGTVMDHLVDLHGDRLMVTEPATGRTLTYRDASRLVTTWSSAIAGRIGTGDRVVVGLSGYDQFLMCLAIARAGCVPVPLNPQMRSAERDHVTADARPALVIDSLADVTGRRPSAVLTDPATAEPGDVAALFYTSGTTGSPKGAELTHRSLVGQIGPMALVPDLLHSGEGLAALPVAHIMGFITYLGFALAGIPLVCFERFRPMEIFDQIEDRGISMFVGVPAMYRMLLEAGAADRDLRSVRVWLSGADVMPPELIHAFKRMGASVKLPGLGPVGEAAFVEGYGMVEVGGAVAIKVSPPGPSFGADALGFRVPGYRLRVVDDAGRTRHLGQTGELWLKGPGVLRGYWDAPEATAAVLDLDGWLHTGDLVQVGPFGTIIFKGRSKLVLKSGGYSVYPREVEAALEHHPEVLEAAVVGQPDAKLGEVPVAAVRVLPESTVTPEQIIAYAADRLSSYKTPRRVIIVDELPRTGTDKVEAAAVRALFT